MIIAIANGLNQGITPWTIHNHLIVGELFPLHNLKILGDILINFELLSLIWTSLWRKYCCKSLFVTCTIWEKILILKHIQQTLKHTQRFFSSYIKKTQHFYVYHDLFSFITTEKICFFFDIYTSNTCVCVIAYYFTWNIVALVTIGGEFGHSLLITVPRFSMYYFINMFECFRCR